MIPRRSLLAMLAVFASGVLVGGFLFVDSQPRSLLSVGKCNQSCYDQNEVVGLLASAGIQRLPGVIPGVVKETDRCLAIRHPYSSEKFHFVIFPKKDIKNIADITEPDQVYVLDCLSVLRELVEENSLKRYRVYTNGPGRQEIAYLHFHLAP